MSKKTYKRETAWLILLWVVYLSIWGNINALTIVVYPAFGFILAAFGFDWYGKQLLGNPKFPNGRRANSGSEYPDRED